MTDPLSPDLLKERIRNYYTESSLDYHAWSPSYNMHFGYFRWGINPFRRESMLEEMNRQVAARMELTAESEQEIIDLGCGLGGPLRHFARSFPKCRITGVSLVPWQIETARHLTQAGNAEFVAADFTQLPFPDGRFHLALAIESSCHAEGGGKPAFVREAARCLKTGGRLVVADGFLKLAAPLPRMLRPIFKTVCRNWALESFAILPQFTTELKRHGFEIRVEEISWRIAPSVLHIPWVTTKFLVLELFKSRLHLSPARRGHLLACLLSPLVGLARRNFGYFLITAKKLPKAEA
jgi:MPBQ/MSBQ methyltransferase